MDVLIKNIEIPKDNKRLALFIDKDGEVSVFDNNDFARITDAIEVPPHGRLVDADKVTDSLKYFCIRREEDWFSLTIKNKIVTAILEDAPTVLEASTKHGQGD